LYGFGKNDTIKRVDLLGMQDLVYGIPGAGVVIKMPPQPPPTAGTKKENYEKLIPGYYGPPCEYDKKSRLSPIPRVTKLPRRPFKHEGTNSGWHEIHARPLKDPVGSTGAAPCTILVVKCPLFVAVFHFKTNDSASRTLAQYNWPSGCFSIMCGGDDTYESNWMAYDVMMAAGRNNIKMDAIYSASGCGVNSDGSWWDSNN
jgi:hypothetical protein